MRATEDSVMMTDRVEVAVNIDTGRVDIEVGYEPNEFARFIPDQMLSERWESLAVQQVIFSSPLKAAIVQVCRGQCSIGGCKNQCSKKEGHDGAHKCGQH